MLFRDRYNGIWSYAPILELDYVCHTGVHQCGHIDFDMYCNETNCRVNQHMTHVVVLITNWCHGPHDVCIPTSGPWSLYHCPWLVILLVFFLLFYFRVNKVISQYYSVMYHMCRMCTKDISAQSFVLILRRGWCEYVWPWFLIAGYEK
jgi:hypothetical protein